MPQWAVQQIRDENTMTTQTKEAAGRYLRARVWAVVSAYVPQLWFSQFLRGGTYACLAVLNHKKYGSGSVKTEEAQ